MTRPENQPTAVILTIDEGGGLMAEMELVFASRWQAEWFVYQLPYLMTIGQWSQVKAAMIAPLIPSNSTGLDVRAG